MQPSIFIEKDDVVKLTGTKIRKLQIEHLLKSNIPFKQDRNGYPLILLDSIKPTSTQTVKTPRRKIRVNPTPLNGQKEVSNG